MDLVLCALFIVLAGLFAGLFYIYFQLKRNDETYKLVGKWIDEDDERYYMYSYEYIFKPSKHNWFGLKIPKDSDFKK